MTVETADYVAQLDPAEPGPASRKQQGDDHIRLLKKALRQSFAGFPGAVLVGGTDTGVSNAYVLSPEIPLVAYSVNMTVIWQPANTNGGASTINISGLGAVPIRRIDGTPTENGDIMAGTPVSMMYNGSQFRLVAVTKRYVDNLVTSGVLPGQTGNAGKPLITDGTNASFSSTYGVAIDEAEGAPIASASTLNLTSAAGTGNFTHITGNVQINAMTLPAGAARDLVFDGTPVIANSGSLILPTGANITAQAGDTARVRGEGLGVVRVVNYQRASGRAVIEPTSPGLALLASMVPTAGAAAMDFLNVFSGAYDDYFVTCDNVTNQAGNNVGLFLQLAQASIVDSANNYAFTTIGLASTTATGSAGSSNNSISTTNGIGLGVQARAGNGSKVSVRINICGANNSAIGEYQAVYSSGIMSTFEPGGVDTMFGYETRGMRKNASAGPVSGLRLVWPTAGNVFAAGGVIRIYGYKKA